MSAEVEALREADHAVLVMRILQERSSVITQLLTRKIRTHSLSFCRMLTSTRACW